MQLDFHYYATYCAAFLAGYGHDECCEIAYGAQFADCCTAGWLSSVKGPLSAATTQSQAELLEMRTDLIGLQTITRIWASFHFLPADLHAVPDFKCGKRYLKKYRLICGPCGELAGETVELAAGKGTEAAGLAMHVIADTWAHRHFAGTPSFVINNVSRDIVELLPASAGEGAETEYDAGTAGRRGRNRLWNLISDPAETEEGGDYMRRNIRFRHSPSEPDDPAAGLYSASVYRTSENSVMNLGHGRAGHLPDYSFARYRYLPAWGNFREITKDNTSDYYHAFCQMVNALEYLRGCRPAFDRLQTDSDTVRPYAERIRTLLEKRQTDACGDWKDFCAELSGTAPKDFVTDDYKTGYLAADKASRDDTPAGRFILAALAQKSMVTNRIYRSGNLLAGISVDFEEKGFRGIRDFRRLVEAAAQVRKDRADRARNTGRE